MDIRRSVRESFEILEIWCTLRDLNRSCRAIKYTNMGSFLKLYNTGEDEVREHIPTPLIIIFSLFNFRYTRGDNF